MISKPKSKKCIISFSCKGRENYNKAVLRMINSALAVGWDGDFIIYSSDDFGNGLDEYKGIPLNHGLPNGCKSHSEVPYQFKPFLFEEAIKRGYEQIIWVDSTIVFNQYPSLPLERAKQKGVVVYDNLGYSLRDWISIGACQKLGITTEERNTFPMIMACAMVMDITVDIANDIFNDWYNASNDNVSFAGHNPYQLKEIETFRAHRHDQSVISYLVTKAGIEYEPYGELCYADNLKPGAVFVNTGL